MALTLKIIGTFPKESAEPTGSDLPGWEEWENSLGEGVLKGKWAGVRGSLQEWAKEMRRGLYTELVEWHYYLYLQMGKTEAQSHHVSCRQWVITQPSECDFLYPPLFEAESILWLATLCEVERTLQMNTRNGGHRGTGVMGLEEWYTVWWRVRSSSGSLLCGFV